MPKCILILASSGRMLAQAAKKSGYLPLVLDLFADEDTQQASEYCMQVSTLSLLDIQAPIEKLLKQYAIQYAVYGSGLETHLSTLQWLESVCSICGNSADVLGQYLNPSLLFPLLQQLDIAYPAVQFTLPTLPLDYLIKSPYQSGGVGIQFAHRSLNKGEYYQQWIAGESGSVLFFSSNTGIDILGFHKQWTLSVSDFSFSGIVQQSILPAQEQQSIRRWLTALHASYSIQGLGSLDFIWDGACCYFLELNLRPSASMMLYPELDLFTAQLTGIAPIMFTCGKVRGLQVLYAEFDCQLPSYFQWPSWCFDRPRRGTRFKAGEAICSIMCDETTVHETESRLQQYATIIKNNVIK